MLDFTFRTETKRVDCTLCPNYAVVTTRHLISGHAGESLAHYPPYIHLHSSGGMILFPPKWDEVAFWKGQLYFVRYEEGRYTFASVDFETEFDNPYATGLTRMPALKIQDGCEIWICQHCQEKVKTPVGVMDALSTKIAMAEDFLKHNVEMQHLTATAQSRA